MKCSSHVLECFNFKCSFLKCNIRFFLETLLSTIVHDISSIKILSDFVFQRKISEKNLHEITLIWAETDNVLRIKWDWAEMLKTCWCCSYWDLPASCTATTCSAISRQTHSQPTTTLGLEIKPRLRKWKSWKTLSRVTSVYS